MTDRLELAERVEKATGPDRELDCAIHVELFVDKERAGRVDVEHGYVGWWPKDGPYVSAVEPLHYSASLDAAMTLVPEGCEWGVGSWGNPDIDGPWAWCATREQSANNDLDYGKASTVALALTAAALRASHSQSR